MRTVADEWWRMMEGLSFDLDSEALPIRLEMSLPMKEGLKTTADEAYDDGEHADGAKDDGVSS